MSDGAVLLPNAPNWYCAKVADWSDQNLIAFGAKNSIYVFDPLSRRFVTILSGHTDRVCAVQWSHTRAILYTGGADRSVRAWDVHRGTQVASHSVSRVEVTALAASALLPDSVVSADRSGKLVLWKHTLLETTQCTPIGEAATCLALSPSLASQCVVGYQSGALALVNVLTGELLARLHGHSAEIQCVQFAPAAAAAEPSAGPGKFASSSRDGSIRIWEGRGVASSCTQALTVPGAGSSGRQKERLWLTVCWLGADELVSSSHAGELLMWSVRQREPRRIQGHTRPVFSLLPSPDRSRLLSLSMDRNLIVWDVSAARPELRLASLGGFAYAVACSPVEPGKVLVGVGDNTLRVWNTAGKDVYDCHVTWPKGVQTKITAVCFHPTDAALYALGTEDGVVACFDFGAPKAGAFVNAHANAAVRAVQFRLCGPSHAELWSVGANGGLLVHRRSPSGALSDGTRVEEIAPAVRPEGANKPHRWACFSWNSRGDALALGTSDGLVFILNAQLATVARLSVRDDLRSVTALSWSSHDPAPRLAIGGDSGRISLVVGGVAADAVARFGHASAVTSLDWSPHAPDLLLSGSVDHTAQVWDAAKARGQASLRGHLGRVLGVAWSTAAPATVFSASDDQSVRLWDLTRPPSHTDPPTAADAKAGDKAPGARKNKRPAPTDAPSPASVPAAPPSAVSASVAVAAPPVGMQAARKAKKSEAPAPSAALFAQEIRSEASATAAVIAEATARSSPSPVHHAAASPFSTRAACLAFVGAEAVRAADHDAAHEASALSMWRGNLAEAVRVGVTADPCNPMWTALAASGGRELWERTATFQARALEAQGRLHDAVMMRLALGDARGAVGVYERAGQWLEAIAVARCQLGVGGEALVGELTGRYVEHLQARGLSQQAARCLLSLGRMGECVASLAAPGDCAALRVACAVATKLLPPAEQVAWCVRLGVRLQAEGRWAEAGALFTERRMHAALLVAAVEQTLARGLAEAEAGEFEEEGAALSAAEEAALPPSALRRHVAASKAFQAVWAAWRPYEVIANCARLSAALAGGESIYATAPARGQAAWRLTVALLALLRGDDASFASEWLAAVADLDDKCELLDLLALSAFVAPTLHCRTPLAPALAPVALSVDVARLYTLYWRLSAEVPPTLDGAALLQCVEQAPRPGSALYDRRTLGVLVERVLHRTVT